MKKLLICFCEGPHDAAFLGLVLKNTLGYKKYSQKIGKLPFPFSYLNQELLDKDIDELRLSDKIMPDIPFIWENNDSIISIYPMGGDSKVVNESGVDFIHLKPFFIEQDIGKVNQLFEQSFRTKEQLQNQIQFLFPTFSKIINHINEIPSENKVVKYLEEFKNNRFLQKNNQHKIQFSSPIHFAFFIDADHHGVENRKKSFVRAYKNELGIDDSFLINSKNQLSDKRNVGLFVFRMPNSDNGDLEDILIDITENSKTEYKDLLALTYILVDKGILSLSSELDKKKHDREKAILGSLGQIKNSGKALQVIIEDSEFMEKSILIQHKSVLELKQFFEDMLA